MSVFLRMECEEIHLAHVHLIGVQEHLLLQTERLGNAFPTLP